MFWGTYGYINRGLGSATDIQQGINQASEIIGDAAGASVILFTDGIANRFDGDKIDGRYYIKEQDTDSRYDISADELNGSYYAGKAGEALKASGADIYTIVLMSKEEDISDLVRVSLGNKSLGYEKDRNKTYLTFTDGGYAREFFTAANAEQLNSRFKQIMTEMTSLPFESSSVTDSLDKHFELVPDQKNVIDNKDGTFTMKFPDKISAVQQTVTVQIKAKTGYTGYSYTNDGCQFNGTTDGLTYTQQFVEAPAAVILPNAVDDTYTVNQDEVLDASTVLANDNNQIVNNPEKKLELKAVIEKAAAYGKITFNEDGTFQYIPDNGFSGKDTFEYKIVLIVDDKEYAKSATVTINVIPKQPETPTEEETPSEPETPTEEETPSEPETPTEEETTSKPETPTEEETTSEPETPTEEETTSEPETSTEEETPSEPETSTEEETPSEPETPTEEETTSESETPIEEEITSKPETPSEKKTTNESEIITEKETISPSEMLSEIDNTNEMNILPASQNDEVIEKTSVKTGNRSNTIYYIMILLSAGTAITTTVICVKKKKVE